ncbi:uncharacterized protein LOC131051209 [Cryptomeria japonica]|uniref:uncharacterized protein LOC131051209 n=1 Tax=Cryptomeria japonica TaxID=3369 RepID=UPI0025AC873D|nr:uncharacterized protein LOC131051209 [Cryptomeria japonica]XP_057841597.1 uncharacterized protein LOC131051209 [Cryptomeria japonica]XP_057841598.1 uncharacterized protein LOC131051209 [Cryptomeria japonica]
MGPIFREMMNNSVMGSAVSALAMAWKKRYITDDQWERLYFEFLYCCSFFWKYPIHIGAFLICAPRLIRILLFFYPLLISTVLFLLVVFSLGPQLERMRVDRDLQWHRFREAAVSVEDGNGVSWACQQPNGNIEMPSGVNSKLAEGADGWAEWTESLEKLDRSIFYVEKHPGKEKDDKNLDFGNTTEEKVEEDGGGPMGVSGKSLILGKVRELMERLIDELGGRVELDALNALESITQVLIESTGMDVRNQGMYTCPFDMIEEEYELSDDKQFHRTLCAGDSELLSRQGTENTEILKHEPCENKENFWDYECERNNPSILAMAEAELKQSYDRHLHETGNVGDSECLLSPPRIDSPSDVGFDHASGISKDEEDLSENLIFISAEDMLIDDVQFQTTGYVQNSDCKARTNNVMSACTGQGNASSVSQDLETSAAVLDGEQNSNRLWEFPRDKLRTCTSLPIDALKDEFRCMDELWEAHDHFGEKASATGKEKDQQKIHSNNCNRDQQEHSQLPSSSVQIPEHKNKLQNLLSGKLRNSISEPITYLKRPQVLTSPVMLVGTAEMDFLWEKYNDASQGSLSARKDSTTDHRGDLQEILDSDAEDLQEPSQVCCLQALKFSKGKMPLRKPSLKKVSKALKKLGLLPLFRSRKTS